MYRAVSFGCLGEDVSMNKYQPRAEMTNVTLFRLKELKLVLCTGAGGPGPEF